MVHALIAFTLALAISARFVTVSFTDASRIFLTLIILEIFQQQEQSAIRQEYKGYPGFKMSMGQNMSQQELRDQLQLVENEIAARAEGAKEKEKTPRRGPAKKRRK